MNGKKLVLIVEDNPLNREMLAEILSEQYDVLQAENGYDALSLLRQHKARVSLILLDLQMPVMDGYTLLGKLREDPDLAVLPVIVTTQSDNDEEEVAALAQGATDFVPKPYHPQVILRRVASLIKLRETAAIINQFQYDRLTGLYSKEFFYQRVRERLAQDPQQRYSIICANVENFKLYNDAFGIPSGNRLLKQIGEVFRNEVGDEAICSRYRADRFIGLIAQNSEYEYRIANGEDGRFCCLVPESNIVMKWGIYEINDPTLPVELMCDRALLAADSIKGHYDKFYAVYDETLRAKLIREQTITDAMEAALEEEQFLVYYQPKYSLKGQVLAGAEALVRWIHPEMGFMSPGEFIPLFEKNGFISRMDAYIWEKVCIQLRDWQALGYPPLPVSVNVSRADVIQGHLVETLKSLIQRYGIDPAYLHLEITESAYAENPGHIISVVEELRKLGFIIEMDDFGSGYSSLNMLSQMDLDILKLDMQFIQNEIAKPIHQSILRDVIVMAHRLQLSVVAEGVETREQMRSLQAMGCDYAQGYFFAKPMSPEDFRKLLDAQRKLGEPPVQQLTQKDADLYRLLIVDDDIAYRDLVRSSFAGHFAITEADNAADALACIREHRQNNLAVVILSMALPKGCAAEIVSTMRQTPDFWEIPVLSIIPCADQSHYLPAGLETDDFICKCHPQFDLRRRILRLIDTTIAHQRERLLQNEANRDYLTGILNRRGLQTALASLRSEDLPVAICLFDLDNLKQINDMLGHETGDRLIQSFADLLLRQTRQDDTLCRYGGDEFLVILKHLDNADAAMQICDRICREFRNSFASGSLTSSCSAGIRLCEMGEKPSIDLIEQADQALYRVKRGTKGTCQLWTPDLA